MQYINRYAERKFIRLSEFFKAVLVTGARQVGKTTMLKHIADGQGRTYVSLDNMMARNMAKSDPVLFFQTYKPPILIDEVQYAPELFSQIKIMCDGSEDNGLFWLTGSRKFAMMKNVRETLAGRIGIMELFSLTIGEKDGTSFEDELDFSFPCLQSRQLSAKENDVIHIFEHIWRGGMPQVMRADAEQRDEYYSSYISTYIIRDAIELGGLTDALRFTRFLTACAALISQLVNYRTLANAADISEPTAKEWLRLLDSLGIVFLLQPYSSKELKRLTKAPKLYFCDTGLAAHLSMWPSRDTLLNGAASGQYFENHVVIELLKHYAYSRSKVNMTFFRDSNAKEIDLLIERNTLTHPLEIKKTANPNNRDVKKFAVLDNTAANRGCGGLICLCTEAIPIDSENCYIPCNLI